MGVGNGDAEAGDGSESPRKNAKTPSKKTKAESSETPKKKAPAKKATSAKKRKIQEAEGEGEAIKDEPKEDVVGLLFAALTRGPQPLTYSRTSFKEVWRGAAELRCCG